MLTLPIDNNEASAAAPISDDRSLLLALDLRLNYSASCEARARLRPRVGAIYINVKGGELPPSSSEQQ